MTIACHISVRTDLSRAWCTPLVRLLPVFWEGKIKRFDDLSDWKPFWAPSPLERLQMLDVLLLHVLCLLPALGISLNRSLSTQIVLLLLHKSCEEMPGSNPTIRAPPPQKP